MSVPENIQKIYDNKVKLGLRVDSYVKRWPELAEKVEEVVPEKVEEVIPEVVPDYVKKPKR